MMHKTAADAADAVGDVKDAAAAAEGIIDSQFAEDILE